MLEEIETLNQNVEQEDDRLNCKGVQMITNLRSERLNTKLESNWPIVKLCDDLKDCRTGGRGRGANRN